MANDIYHRQFCPSFLGDKCACWGVPDKRQLIPWQIALGIWGDDGVRLLLKSRLIEEARNASYYYLEDEVFAS